MVFDVTNQASFDNISKWLQEIDLFAGTNVQKLLVGNKTDLADSRVVPTSEGEALAAKLTIPYVETSAKNSHNVEQAFAQMVRSLFLSFSWHQLLTRTTTACGH